MDDELKDDDIEVEITEVEPQGSVAIGRGVDVATGDSITFGGDHRAMAAIAEAIEETGESVVGVVPSWAILSRRSAA